jgi:hypothetical protein
MWYGICGIDRNYGVFDLVWYIEYIYTSNDGTVLNIELSEKRAIFGVALWRS